MELQRTQTGKSYWNNEGIYQTEYDKLYEELVPNEGQADTLHGELIRAVSRLCYDYYNNGNMNTTHIDCEIVEESCSCYGNDEECEWCYGGGILEEEYEVYSITPMFKEFLELIKKEVEGSRVAIKIISDMIENNRTCCYNDEEQEVYNEIVDRVIHFCLTTENKPLTK